MNGNYFLLPNTIFDEGLTPMEFAVYSFFISRKDKHGQSYYPIPHIAEYCDICEFRLCITLAEWQRNKANGRTRTP